MLIILKKFDIYQTRQQSWWRTRKAHKERKLHGRRRMYGKLVRSIGNGEWGAVYPFAAVYSNMSVFLKMSDRLFFILHWFTVYLIWSSPVSCKLENVYSMVIITGVHMAVP